MTASTWLVDGAKAGGVEKEHLGRWGRVEWAEGVVKGRRGEGEKIPVVLVPTSPTSRLLETAVEGVRSFRVERLPEPSVAEGVGHGAGNSRGCDDEIRVQLPGRRSSLGETKVGGAWATVGRDGGRGEPPRRGRRAMPLPRMRPL